jgi:phosphoribosylglycinamide formyltransferase 2
MSSAAVEQSRAVAADVTGALGGFGLFGVEFFIKGDSVVFSEVSPRPHDTGMVTLISQDLSEFALHARAILGLPVPNIVQRGPSASAVLLVEGDSADVRYGQLEVALREENTQIRLFGKPEVRGERRLGVALALADTVEEAVEKAKRSAAAIEPTFGIAD